MTKRLAYRRRRRRLRGEDGFSLIELMVAATVAAVGVIALVTTFDASRELVSTSERKQAMSHQAEREMERILALDPDAVALQTAPPTSTDPNNPNYYVQGDFYQWDQGETGPRVEPLLIEPTGALTPSFSWEDSDGRIKGTLHRYVTRYDDPCCLGGNDGKRVTVAVTVEGGEPRKPILMSSVMTKTK